MLFVSAIMETQQLSISMQRKKWGRCFYCASLKEEAYHPFAIQEGDMAHITRTSGILGNEEIQLELQGCYRL